MCSSYCCCCCFACRAVFSQVQRQAACMPRGAYVVRVKATLHPLEMDATLLTNSSLFAFYKETQWPQILVCACCAWARPRAMVASPRYKHLRSHNLESGRFWNMTRLREMPGCKYMASNLVLCTTASVDACDACAHKRICVAGLPQCAEWNTVPKAPVAACVCLPTIAPLCYINI